MWKITQFSEKTDKIIIDDMNEIKNLAKHIDAYCNKCLSMMKKSYVGHDEWANVTSEIIRCYGQMKFIMEQKRGRF
jgi:hypothetical protein